MKINKTIEEKKEKKIMYYIILIISVSFEYNMRSIYRTYVMNEKLI